MYSNEIPPRRKFNCHVQQFIHVWMRGLSGRMRALPKCHTEYFEVFSIVWRSFQCAAGLCVELFPFVLLLNSMMMVLMQTQRRVSCRTFSREVKMNN